MSKHLHQLSSLVLLSGLLISCTNKVNFSQKQNSALTAPTPPPVIPIENPTEPPPPGSLIEKSGTCPVGTPLSVLSCLNCESEADTPAPSILSRKAQELWDIMTVSCSIHNASDPRGYKAPSREDLLKRLVRCSPSLYPDTQFVNSQQLTIQALLSHPTAQKSAFSSLYYNWASTDFETYFGLDIGEARYTFCRGQRAINSGGVYPKEYYDAWYNDRPYELPSYWKKAQVIRQNLRHCMSESLRDPNVDQPPGTPGKTCSFETAEGEMGAQIVNKANGWIQQKKSVYYEGFGQCGVMEYPDSFLDYKGFVKIAVKNCQ